jgi:predicted Zn finger-like uncharacterized protein
MLIVCPSCATSYMIEPASLGAAGRTVRCARCRKTWFVNPPQADEPVGVFVDGVIAEAEAQASPRFQVPAPPAADDFGAEEPPAFMPPPAAEPEPAPPHPPHIEAPSLVPPIEHAPAGEPEPAVEETDSFADRRLRLQQRRQKSRRSSRWTAIILVLFAFNVALVGARSEVVRFLPQTASLFAAIGLPVNLRQLSFEDVRVSRETDNGATVLAIEGKIVSKASRTVEVPRLRFAARNAQGREIYTWTARPERNSIGPSESFTFHSFAKPPEDAVDVLVRFFNAQDATGG